MEITTLKLGMFETLGIAVLAIYLGEYTRTKFPILKKYCLPAAVVGGTIFSIISLILYYCGICQLSFNYAMVNSLFYCIFFAASGASASVALLKTGGKLVVIFAILAALVAFLQNVLAVSLGSLMGMDPLIALMTGSTPMTGGHGNAAAFAPLAVEAGASQALEVALASATFGLISGCIVGGPFGNFMVRRHHFADSTLDGVASSEATSTKSAPAPIYKSDVLQAVFLMCIALGMGQGFFYALKAFNMNLPIHVCTMLSGIIIRVILDKRDTTQSLLDSIDTVGEFSLALFVSMSIVSMKLWELSGLGLQLIVLLMAQVVFILIFCYFITFKVLGNNYDSAIMAVGHTGFSLGAVPVSMTTMQTVCDKYRYSKLAFFVVPVIGGFISNISNAIIITSFIDYFSK